MRGEAIAAEQATTNGARKPTLEELRRERARLEYMIENQEAELQAQIDQRRAEWEADAANRTAEHRAWQRTVVSRAEEEYGKASQDYAENVHELHSLLTGEVNVKAKFQAVKSAIDEARSMVLLSGQIDGKNEATRAAQLAAALKADPAYQAAESERRALESEADEATAQVEVTRRRIEGCKATLRFVAAKLEALAQ